ncbi:hypothetical protein BKA69DRAFT_633594 [Paraphysoderma sedebokerense]|nr:hypothetical protein BKA69DRAFT_633594 [Paraphysoderma sedebokerense]
MSNPRKPKYDVSASSVLELKAELLKNTQRFNETRDSSKPSSTISTKLSDKFLLTTKKGKQKAKKQKREDKETKKQERRESSNKGKEKADDEPSWEETKVALERKAKLYDRLKKGDFDVDVMEGGGEIDEKGPLVDFVKKVYERKQGLVQESSSDEESGSKDKIQETSMQEKNSDESESEYSDRMDEEQEYDHVPSRTQNQPPISSEETYTILTPNDPDPLIELTDEFGRARTIRLSELPRHQPQPSEDYMDQEYESYEPARLDEPFIKRYNNRAEIRTVGVGFYQFSLDEEERKRQMEELRKLRQETLRKRNERKDGLDSRARREMLLQSRWKLIKEKRAKKLGLLSADGSYRMDIDGRRKTASADDSHISSKVDMILTSLQSRIRGDKG